MGLSTESYLLIFILFFMWIEYLWVTYLSFRQMKIYKTRTTLPPELKDIRDEETFQKARVYGLDKAKFGNIKAAFSSVLSTALIYSGWIADFWTLSEKAAILCNLSPTNELIVSGFFVFIANTFSTIIELPFTIYYTFVLEEKHGFNKQTPMFFLKDHIKSYFVMQILTVLLAVVSVYIVQRGGSMFIFWLWAFACIMTILLATIYPAVIAPLFDKYSPLPEGELRESIEALAASLKFPLAQLYVVEGSKRSAHSNAYFYGLFTTKRIVLFDTLLEGYVQDKPENEEGTSESENKDESKKPKKKGCSNAEVLAVLAHELGHWSHSHVHLYLFLTQLNLLLLFGVFGLVFKYGPLYTCLGFMPGQQPIVVGFISILQFILAPYNTFLNFGMTVLSRHCEFQADNFAIKLGHSANLRRALIKLDVDNLGFPLYDSLYSSWHHSHPTLLQRIENLSSKKKD